MASKETIKVGTFGPNSPDVEVPNGMQGKTIWYSTKYKFFVVTDHNNAHFAEFTFDKYKEFVDADVIIFNTGIESHMARLMREWEAEQTASDPFAAFDALNNPIEPEPSYDNEYQGYEQETPQMRRGSSRRDDNPANLGDDAASKQKDPTRHIGVFMALTLIFSIIIVIVINFGKPIIQAVAPLLS